MKRSICLNMIVKNESHVIRRCLASVKPVIDHWVIVDTGSSDGTQKIIQDFFRDVPGEIYERPWVDFAHNRNIAMDLAKNQGDYLLFIDADDYLVFEKTFELPILEDDFYRVDWQMAGHSKTHLLLINNHLHWKWEGVVHERPVCLEKKAEGAFLAGATLVSTQEGHRSCNLTVKNQNDIRTLFDACQKDPDNEEILFNLAMNCDWAQNYPLAIKFYEKRAKMGRDPIEVFASLYRIGCLEEKLGMPSHQFIKSYSDARTFRPTRPEPLFYLANYFIVKKYFLIGYLIARHALLNPMKDDMFYSEPFIYDYGLLCQLAVCAWEMGRYGEAQEAFDRLCLVKTFPENLRSSLSAYLRPLHN